ncbi:MAG: DinB family protein [Isosphaeraceae bacterium]|nr:DinB family protein [Isosphaeraceae bacterium]
MSAKDAIRQTLDMSERFITAYVNDLDDGALRLRPIEGMNPIAWQLGHLLSFERAMVEGIKPGSSPPLPEGFDDIHSTDSAKAKKDEGFRTLTEYQSLMQAQRAVTKAVLDGLTDEEMQAPGPERFRKFTPTVSDGLNMVGIHNLMHVGQFVAVRRKLEKPVVV